MNARQPADGPPDLNEDGRGAAAIGTADKTRHYADKFTPTDRSQQGAPRWRVCARKPNGAVHTFGEHATWDEASGAATLLREFGCPAEVVEIAGGIVQFDSWDGSLESRRTAGLMNGSALRIQIPVDTTQARAIFLLEETITWLKSDPRLIAGYPAAGLADYDDGLPF
jgi:hypothetical protein